MKPQDAAHRQAPPAPWASEIRTDEFGIAAGVCVKGVAFVMRWIPPGEFSMGSPEDEAGRHEDEGPQHRVLITKGLWLAETPCTQELWQSVMGKNPSACKAPEHPVEMVSWDDITRFLHRANKAQSGLQLRRPTEAEWEYACRAGATGAHYGVKGTGQTVGLGEGLEAIAWFDRNSGGKSKAVKGLQANRFGLYDMLGNVFEWCEDGYRKYSAEEVRDPMGPEAKGEHRVFRGGSFGTDASCARAADRGADAPSARDDRLGFRLCRDPE